MDYSVQQKISCVFETEVQEEPSKKRSHQTYKVVATSKIKQKAIESGIEVGRCSEKVDGTCCYISDFDGKPWLWARFDRKPAKSAEKKFKKHQALHRAWQFAGKQEGTEPKFEWDLKNDFKAVSQYWIPAKSVEVTSDGEYKPDEIGHTPGWVPVEIASRQYCWHLQGVDLAQGLILVLLLNTEGNKPILEISMSNMENYNDKTLELIGTNINGNPYKIGSKEKPLHVFIPHGEITFQHNPPLDFSELQSWYGTPDGQVEGIVWQSKYGGMFKCHRHHLDLKWPVDNPRLNSTSVKINVDISNIDFDEINIFKLLSEQDCRTFNSLSDVTY